MELLYCLLLVLPINELHAQSETPPYGETRENSASITFNVLKGGAAQILDLFTNLGGPDSVLNHGCWCSKLNPNNTDRTTSGIKLGGCEAIDELDQLCKTWIMNRQCCHHEGGPCFNDQEAAQYEVEYTDGLEDAYCLNNVNDCFIDSCLVDVWYVREVCALTCCDGSCVWDPEPADIGTCQCAAGGIAPPEKFCAGYVDRVTGEPVFRIVHTREEAGLDPVTSGDGTTRNSENDNRDFKNTRDLSDRYSNDRDFNNRELNELEARNNFEPHFLDKSPPATSVTYVLEYEDDLYENELRSSMRDLS